MNTFHIRSSGVLGDILFRWRLWWRARARRLILAARYASGRLSVDDAQAIVCDCEPIAGWFPLLTLTVDDTIELALEEFAEHPELRNLAEEACTHVRRKWEAGSDYLHEAQCWALEKLREYAAIEGIDLHPAAIEIQEQPADGAGTKEA